MRVAVAGSGGLAYWISHFVRQSTSHQLIVLSRTENNKFRERGIQTLAVDYSSPASMEYALTGVDVVISTVRNATSQMRLIDAAVRTGARRYAAAEFEGVPSTDPELDENPDKQTIRSYLQSHGNRIESTIFICGFFYERFGSGGLRRYHIALQNPDPGYQQFLLDFDTMSAEIPLTNNSNQMISFCLTAARDVGRFVARSIDLDRWPAQLTMRGDRLSTAQLLQAVSNVQGIAFHSRNVMYHTPSTLRDAMMRARASNDIVREQHCRRLYAVQNGQYDFTTAQLNEEFPDIVPTRFEQWLLETTQRTGERE